MTLRPYKFVVHAIVQNVDESDVVVGEASAEPVTLYGCESLIAWATSFPERLTSTTE